MVKSILSLGVAAALSTLCSVEAATVGVMELGKGGTLHRAGESSTPSSTNGVMSFWRSLHDADRTSRSTQVPGMSVVPDLFVRADGGVVIGLTGNAEGNLSSMPTVAALLNEESNNGKINVAGNKSGRKLMKGLQATRIEESSNFDATLSAKAKSILSATGNKLESMTMNVNNAEDAKQVDASLSRMLKVLAKEAEAKGNTIVVHLVLDRDIETELAAINTEERRRLDENNNDGNDNADGGDEDGYEIPGYYDDNGVFVTNYRTIFQIQYYGVILWTSVGLLSIFMAANYATMNMPLMPDTLLFGESAKMVAE